MKLQTTNEINDTSAVHCSFGYMGANGGGQYKCDFGGKEAACCDSPIMYHICR